MGEPSAPPRLESEALLRVFFAEHGTKEGLLATLTELEGQALAMRRQAVVQGAEYLAGAAPFQERIHILGLVGRFTLDHTALVAGVGPLGPGARSNAGPTSPPARSAPRWSGRSRRRWPNWPETLQSGGRPADR